MKLFQFLVAALLLVSSSVALAEKPDPNVPNPPLQVKEYNVDADGYIAVHEQGTAKVEVQGTADVNVTGGTIDANVTGGSLTVDNTNANPVPVEGTVTVDNFPGQQGVWVDGGGLSPVTNAYYDFYVMDAGASTGRVNFTNGPILATMIHVSKGDNKIAVWFYSDTLAPADENKIMLINDQTGEIPSHTVALTYPMELSGFKINCLNANDNCGTGITVVGF